MKTTIFKTLALGLVLAPGAQARALDASTYTKSSVLSSGNWAKIAVTSEGIHQITPAQLASWGFNDASKVKVYGYGGTALCKSTYPDIPDDLVPATSMVTADGRVLFYGVADLQVSFCGDAKDNSKYVFTVNRNTYSTKGYYFVTDADNVAAAKPRTVPYVAMNNIDDETYPSAHWSLVYDEEERSNPAMGGNVFIGSPVNSGGNLSFNVPVRDFADCAPLYGKSYFRSEIYSAFNTTSGLYVNFDMSCPEEFQVLEINSPQIAIPFRTEIKCRRGVAYATLQTTDNGGLPDNTYTFDIKVPNRSEISYAAFDRNFFIYPRKNRLHDDMASITMFFNNVNQFDNFPVEGATANTCVWTVDSPSSVSVHETEYRGDDHCVYASFDKTYGITDVAARVVAFNPDAEHPGVEDCGPVVNQNLHGLPTPNLLIITTPGLKSHAEQLAQIHRDNDGINVAVVTQDQVFNEFASGTPSAHAYRRLAKMFYDRESSKFKNLLLYGGGHWDNRGIQSQGAGEMLLTYQAEFNTPKTSSNGWDGGEYVFDAHVNYASDAWFGMLDDNFATDALLSRYNVMRIGVGRLPVTDVAMAQNANDKVLAVMHNPLTAQSMVSALAISDKKQTEGHLYQSDEATNALKALTTGNPAIVVTRAHTDLYPVDSKNMQGLIGDVLGRGVGYLTYSGHGGPTKLGAIYPIWDRLNVEDCEYAQYPFAMLSTCDTYPFDQHPVNLVTDMVLKKNGGVMGAIGAGRTVEMAKNQVLNLASAEVYGATNGKITMGELYRNIVNSANSKNPSQPLTRANTLSYNLCGDPALVMNFARDGVAITDISASGADDGQMCSVDPQTRLTVSGKVATNGYYDNTSFNGTATVTFYNSPYDVVTSNQVWSQADDRYIPYVTTIEEEPIAQVTVPVNNGRFSADMIVPFSNRIGESNRIVVSAYNPAADVMVSGTSTRCRLTDNVVEAADVAGPQITELYLDSPEFCENDVVGSQTTIYATVNVGDAGISPSAVLGGGSKIILDDKRTFTNAAYALHDNGDGTARLAFEVSKLTDGHHKLTLSVADALGNRDQRSIMFIVNAKAATLALEADRLTARDEVEFSINGIAPQSAATLIVRDSKGNTVVEQPNASLPHTWNLRANGQRVADGIYHAFLRYPGSPATVVNDCSFTVIE